MTTTNQTIQIAQFSPHPRNYNRHSELQVQRIAASLQMFGQVRSVVVWRNFFLAGHGVREGALKLGWTELRADVLPDDYPEELALAYVAADNELGRLSDPDNAQLAQILEESRHYDDQLLAAIGYDDQEFTALLKEVERDTVKAEPSDAEAQIDKAAVLLEKWQVQPGDLWRIGEHVLACGDCTDPATVARVMGGEKADLAFTSPPYNAGTFGYDDGKSKYKKQKDDNLSQDDYFGFLVKFTDLCIDHCSMALVNIQMLSGNRFAVARYIGHYADGMKDVFAWIKNTAPPNVNPGVFTNRVEFVFCIEPKNTKKGFDVSWQGRYSNVIEGGTAAIDNMTDGAHSATMPLYLPVWFFEKLDFAKLVYEPFAGSGTTIVACQNLGRRCRAIEISPAYCAVILQRMDDAFPALPIERVLNG